ncbi:MAG: hypothetical protein EBR82_34825, partial [Caulobacteraceae bacterium]|nr:hypothetical protein [Caulobacteraceae bacterium]
MAIKDCTFFVDVNGRQVEMDFDGFRAYLMEEAGLARLAPDLFKKRGKKAGFEAARAEAASVRAEATPTKAEAAPVKAEAPSTKKTKETGKTEKQKGLFKVTNTALREIFNVSKEQATGIAQLAKAMGIDLNQIRLARGEVKPVVGEGLEQRGVTSEKDAEYIAAVKAGDTAKAQKMVDEAAKAAGYDSEKFYHGTVDIWTVADTTDRSKTFDTPNAFGDNIGLFLSSRKKTAEHFAAGRYSPNRTRVTYDITYPDGGTIRNAADTLQEAEEFVDGREGFIITESSTKLKAGVDEQVIYTFHHNITNPKTYPSQRAFVDDIRVKGTSQASLIAEGYDGVLIKGNDLFSRNEKWIVVFNPSQVKSADPVTYDDKGNVIPLSKRFRPETPDMRYQMGEKTTPSKADAEYMAAVKAGDTAKAQKIVDEAAKAAGYNETGSHGLAEGKLESYAFDMARLGRNTKAASAKLGFFFASPDTARAYSNISLDEEAANDVAQQARRILSPLLQSIPKGLSRELDYARDNLETLFSTTSKDEYEPESYVSSVQGEVARYITDAEFYILDDEEAAITDVQRRQISEAIKQAQKQLEATLSQVPDFSVVKTGAVVNAVLRMQNPFVYDQKGRTYRERTFFDIIQKAKAEGHDSVIIKNTYDGGPLDDIKVVFEPNQIKSAAPVTYDYRGNIIPPSQRFKAETP